MAAVRIKFQRGKSEFYSTLSKRVDAYFKESGKSKNANFEMIWKTFFFIGWVGTCYYLLMSNQLNDNLWLFYLVWTLLGLGCAFTAVNIGHDAIHGAYSSKKWVNKLMSQSFNILGASAYMWDKMHNQAHHMNTNIQDYDEDLNSIPIIRLSPDQKLRKIQKWQYLYSPIFYGLGSIAWVFFKDYKKFLAKDIGGIVNNHSFFDWISLFFWKFVYYALFIVVPFTMIDGVSWGHILGGFLIMHYFEGLALAIIFMLAHLVEGLHFPKPNEDGSIENRWAIHQLHTTADFAPNNLLAKWYTGGLNFQAVHHLYPKICHTHYPALHEILKVTAKEFDVPYIVNKSFFGALGSHFRFMRLAGTVENFRYVPFLNAKPVSSTS